MVLMILKGIIALKTVIVDLLFKHITLVICNRSNFVVQLNTGAEKKIELNFISWRCSSLYSCNYSPMSSQIRVNYRKR